MTNWVSTVGFVALGLSLAGSAHADRAFLAGGTVIEGKVVRKGSRVVIQVESGEIAVPADSVLRIERGESPLSQFESRRAALGPADVKGRLALADFCRDHEMRAKEKQLLSEVIEIERDNVEARSRLGYVKTESGWLTQADAMRAKGLVEHEGRWMSPFEVDAIERRRATEQQAEERRETSERELALKKAELDLKQAEADEKRRGLSPAWGASYFAPIYGPAYRYPYAGGYGARVVAAPYGAYPGIEGCFGERDCAGRRAVRPPATKSTADTSMSVVKVPYRHP